MKPFLHERLHAALLLELSSEHYSPGSKFLSLREISKRFGVSKPTANLVQGRLIKEGFLESRPRSGVYVTSGTTERAMLRLDALPIASIPKPKTWNAQRSRVLQHAPEHALRVGIIYHGAGEATTWRGGGVQIRNGVPPSLRGLRGCLEVARKNDAAIEFALHDGSASRNAEVKAWLQRGKFEGLLIIQRNASFPELHPLIDPLLDGGVPVVNLFGSPQGADIINVEFNNVASGFHAVSLLAEAGRKKIVLLMQDVAMISAVHRAEGAKLAANQLGVDLEIMELHREEAEKQVAARMADWPPEAVLGLGFDYVVWAIAAGRRSGLVPGSDYSCLGFSSTPDLPGGGQCDIMRMDFDAAGGAAMRTLLDEIGGKDTHRVILIPMKYEDWGSVAAK